VRHRRRRRSRHARHVLGRGPRLAPTYEDAHEIAIEPPEGSPEDGVSPDLLFVKVPDAKDSKNRLHLDLRPTDQAAEVSRLEGLGARQVDIGQGEPSWVVLADPEGNEFCVLRPLAPQQV